MRKAGDVLVEALHTSFVPLPSDDVLMGEFRSSRDDYAAVVEYVRANSNLSRINRSETPERYYTFSGEEGFVSALDDPSIKLLLSDETLPDIIDGDLRPSSHKQELQFVNHRSGTVVAGASKGISFIPNRVPDVVIKSLDDIDIVRASLRNDDSKCAYRIIEPNWFIFVCI